MARTLILLISLLLLLTFIPEKTHCQTRAMCFTQLSLANQACSLLPLRKEPRGPQAELELLGYEEEQEDHDHSHDVNRHHYFNDTKQEHKYGDDDDDDDKGDGGDHDIHGHGHGRRRGRRRGHRRHGGRSHVNQECCWWLKELDTVCVCEVLIRLPKFLTSPHHNYTVSVGDTCEVTYDCGGF